MISQVPQAPAVLATRWLFQIGHGRRIRASAPSATAAITAPMISRRRRLRALRAMISGLGAAKIREAADGGGDSRDGSAVAMRLSPRMGISSGASIILHTSRTRGSLPAYILLLKIRREYIDKGRES